MTGAGSLSHARAAVSVSECPDARRHSPASASAERNDEGDGDDTMARPPNETRRVIGGVDTHEDVPSLPCWTSSAVCSARRRSRQRPLTLGNCCPGCVHMVTSSRSGSAGDHPGRGHRCAGQVLTDMTVLRASAGRSHIEARSQPSTRDVVEQQADVGDVPVAHDSQHLPRPADAGVAVRSRALSDEAGEVRRSVRLAWWSRRSTSSFRR